MNDSRAPVDRQKVLLEKEDWRFHAIDFVGTGLGSIATTERIGKAILAFSLPSAPALFLSLAQSAHQRRSAIPVDAAFIEHAPPQGIWPEDHTNVFDFFEAFLAEIICAYTAIEAFANESIPADFKYKKRRKDNKEMLDAIAIEKFIPLDEKLKRVLPCAHAIPSPAGTIIWERYLELSNLRNRLIHLKAIDRKSSGPEHRTIWGELLNKREHNFAKIALETIAVFPSLVGNRRWFTLAQTKIT